MKNDTNEKVIDTDLEYNDNGTVKLTKKLRTDAIESLEETPINEDVYKHETKEIRKAKRILDLMRYKAEHPGLARTKLIAYVMGKYDASERTAIRYLDITNYKDKQYDKLLKRINQQYGKADKKEDIKTCVELLKLEVEVLDQIH